MDRSPAGSRVARLRKRRRSRSPDPDEYGYWLSHAGRGGEPRAARRNTLRHARETAHHREAWLKVAVEALEARYELGVEALACRRLVKGYSDTHARGLSKFDRVIAAVPKLASREDGPVWLERLKRAALADENGVALDGVLKTVATL